MAMNQKSTSISERNKDNGWKGAESEARFLLECARRHWEVARPLTDMHKYDFVIRRPTFDWETVQVKSCYSDKCGSGSKRLAVPLRSRTKGKNKPYVQGNFDLLCAVDRRTDRIWLVPFECVKHLASNLAIRQCECFLLGEQEPDFSDLDALTKSMITLRDVNGNAKLDLAQAQLMRDDFANGKTRASISKETGISLTQLGRILRGDCWANKDTTCSSG